MRRITIAAIQSRSIRGDIDANVSIHTERTKQALRYQSNLVIFPELSLTGYEPDLAASLVLDENDKRLNPLKELSRTYGVTIAAGAPVPGQGEKSNIGAIIITPERSFIYRKNYLHPGEEQAFSQAEKNCCIVKVNEYRIGLAICADINHEDHPRQVAQNGAEIYAAGVLILGGYQEAADHMQNYAKRHSLVTVMANHGGPTCFVTPSGKSSAWDKFGTLLSTANNTGEELLLITGNDDLWTARTVPVQ